MFGTMTRDIGARQPAIQSSTSPSFKKRLTWVEPKGFRKADLKGSWRSMFGIMGLTGGAVVVILCIATWLDLGAKVTSKVLIAAGAIAVLCVVLVGCTRLMRIIVKITDKAIVWELGDSSTVYRFGAVDHCEIRNTSLGGRVLPVLVVALKNGDRETFGVAPSVSAEVLLATLEQRGVNVVTIPDTMSEQAPPSCGLDNRNRDDRRAWVGDEEGVAGRQGRRKPGDETSL